MLSSCFALLLAAGFIRLLDDGGDQPVSPHTPRVQQPERSTTSYEYHWRVPLHDIEMIYSIAAPPA